MVRSWRWAPQQLSAMFKVDTMDFIYGLTFGKDMDQSIQVPKMYSNFQIIPISSLIGTLNSIS